MNKALIALFLTCLVALSSCKIGKKKTQEVFPTIETRGTAQRYHAALGAGNGVIFLISLSSDIPLNRSLIQIDSTVINGKSVPSGLRADSSLIVEANYFVPKRETLPETPNRIEPPSVNSPDPILYLEHYYPATLYMHYQGKAYALPITEFQSISE